MIGVARAQVLFAIACVRFLFRFIRCFAICAYNLWICSCIVLQNYVFVISCFERNSFVWCRHAQ